LVVLGDNLYNTGLAAKGAPGRAQDERRLDGQLYVAEQYKGRVFFIPGNHDWDNSGKEGLAKIRRQEQYIEQKLNRGNTFVPDNGCPGPYVQELSDELVFIGLDTQWWLHKEEKPYGPGSGCGASTEEEMLRQLEQILEQHRGKHIVVSAHHPLMSNSSHGGNYSVMDHVFPLRLVRDGCTCHCQWWVRCIRITGSWAASIRTSRTTATNCSRSDLQGIFRRFDNITYTAGHDHNLQLHKTEVFSHIISGSGCKTNHIATGNNATFAHREKGFARIRYYTNGEAWVEFWAPEGDGATGKLHYRGLLHSRKQNTAPSVCADTAASPPPKQ
jgi:hypothetical protein